MDLHDLFNTAVDDLPDVPDLVPGVERIHRKYQHTMRSTAIVASTALVLGVGTLTIAAPWSARQAPTSVGAAGSGPAAFPQQLIELLQPIWPKHGERITWDPDAARSVLGGAYLPDDRYLFFKVDSANGSFVLQFNFGAQPGTPGPAVSCPPPNCGGTAGWQVSGNVRPAEFHSLAPGEPSGNLVVQNGITMIAAMSTFDTSAELSVAELVALGKSDQMHELYQDAIDDGLLNEDFDPRTPSPSVPVYPSYGTLGMTGSTGSSGPAEPGGSVGPSGPTG